MKRIKLLIAQPILRLLDSTERALAKLSVRLNGAYIKVWNWTQR